MVFTNDNYYHLNYNTFLCRSGIGVVPDRCSKLVWQNSEGVDMVNGRLVFFSVICALLISGGAVYASGKDEELVRPEVINRDGVNIYSERKEGLIKPLLDQFTAETGIPVNLVTGEGDLIIKRLEIEGAYSPADVLLTTDVARLHRAQSLQLLQPVHSNVLVDAIPEHYRERDGYWYGLSLRSRVMVYSRQRVKPGQLSTYEALADPAWKGRICVRSSSNPYNQSLVSSMIVHNGLAAVEQWVAGLVANFARPPRGGDRDLIKAVAAGECDVALVNTYYLGGMLHAAVPEEREAAEKVALFWPNQMDRGAHFNISGAGVTRSARHRDAAIRLIEFLAGDQAQAWYAEKNFEYPVKPGVPVSTALQQWGGFRADPIDLDQLGQHNAEAVELMDRAGWK